MKLNDFLLQAIVLLGEIFPDLLVLFCLQSDESPFYLFAIEYPRILGVLEGADLAAGEILLSVLLIHIYYEYKSLPIVHPGLLLLLLLCFRVVHFGLQCYRLGKLDLVEGARRGWRGVGAIHVDVHDIRVHVHVDVHGDMLRGVPLVLRWLIGVGVVSLLLLVHGEFVESREVGRWSRLLFLFFLPHRLEIDVVAFRPHPGKTVELILVEGFRRHLLLFKQVKVLLRCFVGFAKKVDLNFLFVDWLGRMLDLFRFLGFFILSLFLWRVGSIFKSGNRIIFCLIRIQFFYVFFFDVFFYFN